MTRWQGLQWKIPSTVRLSESKQPAKLYSSNAKGLGSVAAGFLCRTLITVKPQPKANKDFFNYLGSHFNTQNSMTS